MAIHIHYVGSEWFFDKSEMHLLGQLVIQRIKGTEFEYWYSSDNSDEDIKKFHEAEEKAKIHNDNLVFPIYL